MALQTWGEHEERREAAARTSGFWILNSLLTWLLAAAWWALMLRDVVTIAKGWF
jgi:hypothetical protein